MILAVDTSTLTASAAVVAPDGAVAAIATGSPGTHTDQIVALCAAALRDAAVARDAVTAIAVGAGPGSFTGLRIGLATGKGLAYALGRPLWLASSLAALAYDLAASAPAAAVLVPILDARRGELYAAAWARDGAALRRLRAECVMPPTALAAWLAELPGGAHLAGDALDSYAAALAELPASVIRHAAPRTPSAVGVARAALAGDRADRLHHGQPIYVRPSEAEVKYPDGVPGAWRR